MRAWRWRGRSMGIAPDGHNADSVAAEAIVQLFEGTNWQPEGHPYEPHELRYELMRLVQNIVRNLARRKENSTVSNELDLAHRDEELSDESYFGNLGGASPLADEEAQRNEAKLRLQRFQDEFHTFLDSDNPLNRLFDCICAGIVKREDQAKILAITPQDITNARKRLDRKLMEFAEIRPDYPDVFIQELTHA